MFEFLKKEELKEIFELKQDMALLSEENIKLKSDIAILRDKINELEHEVLISIDENNYLKQEVSRYSPILDIEKEINELNLKKEEIIKLINKDKKILSSLTEDIVKLSDDKESKKKEIIELDDSILLQEFGLYTPIYDFYSSEEYKVALEDIRLKQKEMILNGTAAISSIFWTVNGSVSKGKSMISQSIKQIIRCFNNECDVLVSKVKFNNIKVYSDKMEKSFKTLNKINEQFNIYISKEYFELKLEELQLAYEYSLKKFQEKEELRQFKERLREEAKVLEEIKEARINFEKEKKHYINALDNVNNLLLETDNMQMKEELIIKRNNLENKISEINKSIEDINYREANKKAGYVYIISNIGSFGENVYKIGMTRRLDPEERINELSGASVPFKFDIHAIIFSDDAPKLEADLHKAFYHKKVNMVNNRKEFFNVSLNEIEDVVKSNFDKTVEFVKYPIAQQYRETLKIIQYQNKFPD